MRLAGASPSLRAAGITVPAIGGLPGSEIRAAMERVADRLVESGVPRAAALRMAYESMLRVARRQQSLTPRPTKSP